MLKVDFKRLRHYLSSKLASCGRNMWNLQDAKNRFSAVVEAALAGEPQRVSRRGKPAVVVLSAAQYERLQRSAGGAGVSFRDHLLTFPGSPEIERLDVSPRDVSF